jgi:ribonuclease BN (tRNA processing enzyme)
LIVVQISDFLCLRLAFHILISPIFTLAIYMQIMQVGLNISVLVQNLIPDAKKPNLYLNKETATTLWNRTLSGGMSYIEGHIANIETFFKLEEAEDKGYFTWMEIKFNLIKLIHINNGHFLVPSYGLFFEVDGIKVFLTTDNQFCFNLAEEFYERADIIFQDCETSAFKSQVHAHYEELLTLPEKIKNKMWLYHYQPGPLPDAKKDGFCGFVKRGQTFEFSDIILNSDNILSI